MVKRKVCTALVEMRSRFEGIIAKLDTGCWVIKPLLIALLLASCEERNSVEKVATQNGKDNTQVEVSSTNESQSIINQHDTIPHTSQDSVDEVVTEKRSQNNERKPVPIQEKKPSPRAQPEDGATRHYFKGGKLAVKIDPWSESMQRSIHFYNRAGEEIFTLEDIQQSYSVRTELSFHENGAARLAEISENPGASQYWSKQFITFDEENYPLQRTSQRMPYEDLQTTMKKPEVWNRERRVWE